MNKVKIVGLSIFALALASWAWADDNEFSRPSLKGLTGVGVVVEGLSSNMDGMNLSREQIQTDVELRLRKAGIRVFSKSELLATPGVPYLYVNLGTFPFKLANGQTIGMAFSIDVSIKQNVTLVRDRNATVMGAATWQTGSTGSTGISQIQGLRGVIGDQVDVFINAYFAMNPKQPATVQPVGD
jgi:hypothetical protein